MTEVLSRQKLEKSHSYLQVTYSHSSDEAEKQICDTLSEELATEMKKHEERLETNLNDNLLGIKRCSSLKVAGNQSTRDIRRFSEFGALKKVNEICFLISFFIVFRKEQTLLWCLSSHTGGFQQCS